MLLTISVISSSCFFGEANASILWGLGLYALATFGAPQGTSLDHWPAITSKPCLFALPGAYQIQRSRINISPLSCWIQRSPGLSSEMIVYTSTSGQRPGIISPLGKSVCESCPSFEPSFMANLYACKIELLPALLGPTNMTILSNSISTGVSPIARKFLTMIFFSFGLGFCGSSDIREISAALTLVELDGLEDVCLGIFSPRWL